MVDAKRDRVEGCILGLALGDALGAFHEGGPIGGMLWRGVQAVRGEALAYTDDTEMMIGLVEELIENPDVDQDRLAGRFARNFTAMRGYGPGTRKLLATLRKGASWRDEVRATYPEGSLGNGAAMRVAPLGLVHDDPEKLRAAAERQAEVTHAHPLGKEGAVCVAYAASVAFRESRDRICGTSLLEDLKAFTTSRDYRTAFEIGVELLKKPHDPVLVNADLGNGIEALRSAPTAIYLAARFSDDYDLAVESAIQLGGDTDTIAAMAGGIVGAHVGRAGLPPEPLAKLENRAHLEALAARLAERTRD